MSLIFRERASMERKRAGTLSRLTMGRQWNYLGRTKPMKTIYPSETSGSVQLRLL
jgi:hypothetical protein